MNWDQVEGNWKQFKGKVQQQWGKLTEDDLDRVEGRRTELVGRLQERYGHSREQAERDVDSWTSTLDAGSQGNRPDPGEKQTLGQKRNI